MTVPIIEGFLKGVQADPAVKKVVSVGFCFGGRHAILSAGESALVDAAVAFHPVRLPSLTIALSLSTPPQKSDLLTTSWRSPLSQRATNQVGVAVPAELDVLSKPVLLSIGDKDAMMDMSQVEEAQKVFQTTLAEKRPGVKFEVKVYPNARSTPLFLCLNETRLTIVDLVDAGRSWFRGPRRRGGCRGEEASGAGQR